MILMFFRIVGGFGLISIIFGVLKDEKPLEDILFTIGGICLLIYSIYIQGPIFIPLQIIFTLASIWEIYTHYQT